MSLALAIAASAPAVAQDDACHDRVRAVADAFGQGLRDAGTLRGLLPTRGKVRLHLIHLGAEDGAFSASQVDALLRDFAERGAVNRFEVARVETERDACVAVVTCRVALTDRDGRPARVDLRLSIQPEDDRWVVREIRESPR